MFEEGVSSLLGSVQLSLESSVQAVALLFSGSKQDNFPFMGFSNTENASRVPALRNLLFREDISM